MPAQPKSKLKSVASSLCVGGLAVIMLGLAYVLLTPKSYEATARVKVWEQGWQQTNAAHATYDPKLLLAAECQLIRSNVILDQVVGNLGLGELWGRAFNHGTPLDTNQARLLLKTIASIRPSPAAGVIQITVTGAEPEQPAKIANEIARVYFAYRQSQAGAASRTKMTALRQQWEALNQQTQKAQAELYDRYEKESRERAVSATLLDDPQNYTLLRTKRISLETEYLRQKSIMDGINHLDREKQTQLLSVTDGDTNSFLSGALDQLSRARSELTAALNEHGASSPEVQSARLAVDSLQKKVDETVDGILAVRNAGLASLKASLDDLTAKLARASTNLGQLAARNSAYEQAVRDFEKLRRQRDALQQQLDERSYEESVIPVAVSAEIVDSAEPSNKPAAPDPRIANSALFAGGLGVVFGLLLLLPPSKPGPGSGKG